MSAIQTYFQDFLTNIRLPDNLKKALISAHTELREQLKSDDLTKDLLVESFLQGSYARSTCIKPAPGKKVDVDVIVVTNIDHDTVSAQEAFAIITPFVKKYYQNYEQQTFGDQQVYISFSGGKDSTVLSSLVCSLKPNILHLFSDTGWEYPETISFVEEERRRGKNIVSVYPICRDGSIWTFERIVATYGYPLFSKAIANGIRTYRHAKTPITKQHALDYLEHMYPQALSYLDYNISALCCEKLKKSPLKRMARQMQMQCSIIGTLEEESQIRKRDWFTYGSNMAMF